MNTLRKRSLQLGALTTMIVISANTTGHAADNSAAPISAPTLGVAVTLPPLYEPTIQSVGALAATGATALKTYRSDTRAQSIRAALSRALLAASPIIITLDKTNTDPTVGEIAVLCAPRAAYASEEIYQSYLNNLVQNIDAVSTKVVADSTIFDALKLLFATSSYAITDGIGVDQKTVANVGAIDKAACEADLRSYAKDYYGIDMPVGVATPAAVGGGGVDLSFLGPVGTLISTFLGIIEPVLMQAAGSVDQQHRKQAIRTALADNAAKVAEAGAHLANAIDVYVTATRHRLAGAFVEQLVSIRTTQIDLSKVEECKTIKTAEHLPSGALDPAFIACWSAAWAKLQSQVDKLRTMGENYDAFVDAGTKTAGEQFATIMGNYKKIQAGDDSISISKVFGEITQFINFANAVSNAASKTNIDKLKSATAAVEKAVGQ